MSKNFKILRTTVYKNLLEVRDLRLEPVVGIQESTCAVWVSPTLPDVSPTLLRYSFGRTSVRGLNLLTLERPPASNKLLCRPCAIEIGEGG